MSTLSQQPVLILDCQTSGATPDSGAMIEIAWYLASAESLRQRLPKLAPRLTEGIPQLTEGIPRLTEGIPRLTELSPRLPERSEGPTPPSKGEHQILRCAQEGGGKAQAVGWKSKGHQEFGSTNIQSYFIKPSKSDFQLPRRIEKITGISTEDLANGLPLKKIKKLLADHITGGKIRPKPRFAVVHFASFEKRFLDRLFGKRGFPMPFVCTHQIAKQVYADLPSKSLRGVAGFLDWENLASDDAHLKRALHHVDATAWIWQRLCADLEKQNVLTYQQLNRWLAAAPIKKSKKSFPIEQSLRLNIPDRPGVYRLLSKSGKILYIGKATSLHQRVNSYFRGQKGKNSRLWELVSQVKDIGYTVCATEVEAALLENDEIKKHLPPYNVALKNQQESICFTDRNFGQISEIPTDATALGPFSNQEFFTGLNCLFQCIQTATAEYLPETFLDNVVDKLLIEAGLLLFLKQHALHAEKIKTPRQLLAIGLNSYRQHEKFLAKLALESENDLAPETDEEKISEVETDVVWTVELVADAFHKILRHYGRIFWQARALRNLQNAVVIWTCGRGRARLLHVENAQIKDALWETTKNVGRELHRILAENRSKSLSHALKRVDFDRLKILKTEILKLRAKKRVVSVSFMFHHVSAKEQSKQG